MRFSTFLLLPYILLVTFYTPQFNKLTERHIEMINNSPYNGVAVPLIGAYDTKRVSEHEFKATVKLLKEKSQKEIWPWVFFNRFIGFDEKGRYHSKLANQEYFKRIKGIDIYNKTGALADFKEIWRISLRIAKKLNSPGIVIDPKAYNNYRIYNVSYVAKKLGKSESEIIEQLKKVGSNLIDIVEEEYPDATLWFLFTGLSKPIGKYYRTVTYIIIGMLERAKERNIKVKFVSGGEVTLGYCYKSLDDMKNRVKKRKKDFSYILKLYPNLKLGGTIAPWYKSELRKGWMLRGRCKESELKNIEDFKPLITYLLKSYNYVWIYAAGAAGYNPYKAEISRPYNKIIYERVKELKD